MPFSFSSKNNGSIEYQNNPFRSINKNKKENKIQTPLQKVPNYIPENTIELETFKDSLKNIIFQFITNFDKNGKLNPNKIKQYLFNTNTYDNTITFILEDEFKEYVSDFINNIKRNTKASKNNTNTKIGKVLNHILLIIINDFNKKINNKNQKLSEGKINGIVNKRNELIKMQSNIETALAKKELYTVLGEETTI